MDAKFFLKRIMLIAVAGALIGFAGVASGHSSGGSSGGHSGGSSGGPSSSASSGGHSSSASNSGHSSSASNGGHSNGHSSKVGHTAGNPSIDPVAVTGGRSVLVSSVRPNTVRTNEVHQFSTGYVPNKQWENWWRKHLGLSSGYSPDGITRLSRQRPTPQR
jgi:hypothetical protein